MWIKSISVTANKQIKQDKIFENQHRFFIDPPKKMVDKIIPDITNYNSIWVEYNNSQTKENNDISNLYYYIDTNQPTTQLAQSIDLTSLIIQITESTVTNYIQTLADFGPRKTGTSACDDAGNYIASVFNAMGLNVRIQQWSYGSYQGNNIEATLNGINETSNQVYLVCGHFMIVFQAALEQMIMLQVLLRC